MIYNFLRFPGGKPKAVTFSYDDGSKSDIKFLEIVNKYNLKGTFNLVGSVLNDECHISVDFAKENILGKGHEIANHGYKHRALNMIRTIEGIRDTLDSRLFLEKEFDTIIRGMAFPDRSVNKFISPDAYKRVKNYLEETDIAYARLTGGDNDKFELPEDWHNWVPTAHHDNPEIMNYIDKFVELNLLNLYCACRTPRIFYLWGHSVEFESKNNWEHLEEICQKLSGREDVWYATNIEIYDYVKAYEALKYSADGTIVYNPTIYEIWFDVEGKVYSIKPGETIRID